MLVRSLKKGVILCFILFNLIFLGLGCVAIGDYGGSTSVKSDLEMMAGVPVHGGGHVTWEIKGEAANELRKAIILYYDSETAVTEKDGILQASEVGYYTDRVDNYLTDIEVHYHGAKLHRFSLLNHDVDVDTNGLIGKNNESTGNIRIDFYFDSVMPSGEKEILLSDTTVAEAVYTSIDESYEPPATISIEHTSYFVSVSNFAEPEINEGTFYLIRTPFGEIYYYKVSFTAGEGSRPNDRITYQPFNWFEAPLVLFLVVVIFGYFIVTMPGRYRRVDVVKIGKLHTLATVLLLVLLLLYFFAGFGGIFISGLYIWILSIVFLIISYVVSKTLYENAPSITTKGPPKPTVPPPKEMEGPMEEPTEPTEAPSGMKVQCTMCGEIFPMQVWETPGTAKCPACFNIGATEIETGDSDQEGPEEGSEDNDLSL